MKYNPLEKDAVAMTTNQIKKTVAPVNLNADPRCCRAASPFPAWGPLLLSILSIFICTSVEASNIDNKKAILAIIGEAENQGDRGMLAVACAIRNRGTLKGVYGVKAERVINKKYSKKTYAAAVKAWELSKVKDITNGADHWENINTFGKPYWAINEVFRYKDHVFYKTG